MGNATAYCGNAVERFGESSAVAILICHVNKHVSRMTHLGCFKCMLLPTSIHVYKVGARDAKPHQWAGRQVSAI